MLHQMGKKIITKKLLEFNKIGGNKNNLMIKYARKYFLIVFYWKNKPLRMGADNSLRRKKYNKI
jgi:hypothetical protein